MKLKILLEDIFNKDLPAEFANLEIESISSDSRQVGRAGLFVALKGPVLDGGKFIQEAISKGAAVIVKAGGQAEQSSGRGVCILDVEDPKDFLVKVAERFYNHPSKKVKVIGITGTNGKTTTSYLIESILQESSKKCAVIGTVNYRIGGKILPSKNTTPGIVDNQRYLAQMAQEHVSCCAMEVSSHALEQGRVEGIGFHTAVFTNLTGDHMDYHLNMENYFQAKSKLFVNLPAKSFAVINVDDPYGKRLIDATKAKVVTFGITHTADIMASDIKLSLSGSTFSVKFPQGKMMMRSSLIGRHNIYNILAAVGACLCGGVTPEKIEDALEHFSAVPGRLEQIDEGRPFPVFIDYAHTEDALKNVLTNLKIVSNARIILVFGCGGDRDKTKRPKMGLVAGKLADFSILTSDNPRSEDPQSIIDQIIAGFKTDNYTVILDREKAIAKAMSLAKKEDIVLIAGKGHEDYQIFKDKTIPFDDREVARRYRHV